jgi:hypothetical protein
VAKNPLDSTCGAQEFHQMGAGWNSCAPHLLYRKEKEVKIEPQLAGYEHMLREQLTLQQFADKDWDQDRNLVTSD